MEMLEIMTGFEMQNKYTIMTREKQPILHAAESSEFCARCMMGGSRPFEMRVYFFAFFPAFHVTLYAQILNGGQQILTIKRDCRFYFHEVTVTNTLTGEVFGLKPVLCRGMLYTAL